MAKKIVILDADMNWQVPDRCYIVDLFLVGGGGGGGGGNENTRGGGGGGGQIVIQNNFKLSPGDIIPITIGRGGAGGAKGQTGNNGLSTKFLNIEAAGGQGGAGSNGAGGSSSLIINQSFSQQTGCGGAGGGASPINSANSNLGADGYFYNDNYYSGGGGGVINSIGNPASGGLGGGGRGGYVDNANKEILPLSGDSNTGGGGGGGFSNSGANGGSGIIIVSYEESSFKLITSTPAVFEGNSITVSLLTSNVWSGSKFNYTLSGDGVSAQDFIPARLNGTFNITADNDGKNGRSNVVLTIGINPDSNPIELVTVSLDNGEALTSFLIGDLTSNSYAGFEDKIMSVADYNDIQAKVRKVLGSSETTDPTFGWGQIVQSSQVTAGQRFGITEWNRLRFDIVNSWVHIFNVTPSLSIAELNAIIRGDPNDAPYSQYDTFANNLSTNRFLMNVSQGSTVVNTSTQTSWPGTFGSKWKTRISAIINVSFASAQQARHFFNSGSEIRLFSERFGGIASPTPGFIQNDSWSSLLASAGTVSFSVNSTDNINSVTASTSASNSGVQNTLTFVTNNVLNVVEGMTVSGTNVGSGRYVVSKTVNLNVTTITLNSNTENVVASATSILFLDTSPINFYNLTNYYRTFYNISASSPYARNRYTIMVKSDVADNSSGTATSLDFLIQFSDDYQDFPEGDPDNPLPEDGVDGTVRVFLTTFEPLGIFLPAGSGNFQVVSPTVTITQVPRP
jgi:hypothetical protein